MGISKKMIAKIIIDVKEDLLDDMQLIIDNPKDYGYESLSVGAGAGIAIAGFEKKLNYAITYETKRG